MAFLLIFVWLSTLATNKVAHKYKTSYISLGKDHDDIAIFLRSAFSFVSDFLQKYFHSLTIPLIVVAPHPFYTPKIWKECAIIYYFLS